MENELRDIQNGVLKLNQAVTFNRVAVYKRKSVQDIYNEVFEDLCARLQADEKQSITSQIDQYLENFPPIFSQIERKTIIAKGFATRRVIDLKTRFS